MEGVLFVIKAWALAGMGLWLYRRWFERVSGPVPEFESWCASEPVIAALHGDRARLAAVAESIRAQLGQRRRLVATLGGWPWPYYALEVSVELEGATVQLRAQRCALRRTREAQLPHLTEMLHAVLAEHPGAIDDTWLHSRSVVKSGTLNEAEHGWRVEGSPGARPVTRAHHAPPPWLARAEPAKLLVLGSPVLQKIG